MIGDDAGDSSEGIIDEEEALVLQRIEAAADNFFSVFQDEIAEMARDKVVDEAASEDIADLASYAAGF